MTAPTIEARMHEQLQSKITGIADRLHALGDAVQRIADREPRIDLRDKKPDYLGLAHDVMHEVMWGMANLGLDTLVRRATDVDRIAREQPDVQS